MTQVSIVHKMIAIHDRLREAHIDHAFGGALALAWCTQQARGTIDIDVNLFVSPDHRDEVLDVLPSEISVADDDRTRIERDGQARLWWDETPIDVFFNTSAYHEEVADRVRWEPFAGRELPFLSCRDLAVFKVFFNRTKDWADLEAMNEVSTLDVEFVLGIVTRYLGGTDERVERLRSFAP